MRRVSGRLTKRVFKLADSRQELGPVNLARVFRCSKKRRLLERLARASRDPTPNHSTGFRTYHLIGSEFIEGLFTGERHTIGVVKG
jgi:hypothetical protein